MMSDIPLRIIADILNWCQQPTHSFTLPAGETCPLSPAPLLPHLPRLMT